jgi:class 3 adenylate cyclase/tetratricopeptide (TPR) repeat protein
LVVQICTRCRHENPEGARFCNACGAPLATPALEPRFASPQSYTPPLTEKIRSARAEIEGERKQITVLFADVAGFTAMSERLDPEECHAIMRRCFDLMLEEVHRYEGTVSQFLGDGMLALFGAPIAHEDHAQRAVRAALGIQQALGDYQRELRDSRGIVFRVRIGLNSGPVVVVSVGVDLTMDYLAVGDTVNLAARVQALAEPGAVVISEHTHRLVGGYFVTRDLGEHRVKGREQPIRVYAALRPNRWRSRVDVYAERGLSPYVGRRRELEVLLEKFEQACAGHGQLVFLVGDPGIGKSRLLYELKRRLEGVELTWLEGRCISYGRDISYLPIIDVLKDSFRIEEMDDEAEIIRKVEAGVRVLGGELASSMPYLKYLLSVDPGDPSIATMDPQLRKAHIFEALRALTLAGSTIRPLVIVHEDLHWVDRLSEEFLSYIADAVADRRILLILTYRSGYDYPFGERPYYTHLHLANLSERESAELAEGMLATERLPPELQRIIAAKAEGNPFFIEEVIKSLLEVGAIRRTEGSYVLARRVEDIYVPDTVQDVIMARLDRLADEPKRAIQTASVIGREFTVRLLERTAELEGRVQEYLRELKAAELIYERSLYPELAYMFKHALTHDVAYSSLLLARRKVLHRLVGEAIEQLYADRLAEHYETLAYHYERAEAWDRALEYLVKSADKALASFAARQAVAFYDRAFVVIEKSGLDLPPRRAIGLHSGRGQALHSSGERNRSVESFRVMLEAAHEAGDRGQEGTALYWLAVTYHAAHRFEEALDYAERARRLAAEIDDQAILAASLCATVAVRGYAGDLQQARLILEDALRAARQAGIPHIQARALQLAGLLEHWPGDERRAIEYFDEAIRISRQHQVAFVLLPVLWNEAIAHCGLGEYDQALRYLSETLELSARLGERPNRCRVLNTLGWVYMDLCNWERAIQYNAEAAVESRVVGDLEIIRNAELNLGDCYLALGQFDDAQRILETVEREARRQGTWGETWMKWRYTQHLHASLADLWLARGDPARALEYADACLAVAEATSSRRNIVKGRRARGEALLAQGRLDEAEADLETALRVAREVGNPAQLWKTLAALARLRQAQGRPDDAVAAHQEALVTIEGMAASLSDPALRDTLLASPQVAALRAAAATEFPLPLGEG